MISNDTTIALYQSIAEANEERVFKHWHASSIADCPRAHYFKRLGVKPLTKPSAAKVIRWGAGHKLEEQLREHIYKVWDETTSNVRLTSKELDLTGEYDNLTKDGTTLIEVKSVSDWAFVKGEQTALKEDSGKKNKWGRPIYVVKEEPYIHHLLQNHAYVLLLKEKGTEVKNIDFLYASLSGLLCVYKTQVEEKYLQWVKTRLESLNRCWEAKELPPCLCQEDSDLWGPVYQWCEYRNEKGCCDESLSSM